MAENSSEIEHTYWITRLC